MTEYIKNLPDIYKIIILGPLALYVSYAYLAALCLLGKCAINAEKSKKKEQKTPLNDKD